MSSSVFTSKRTPTLLHRRLNHLLTPIYPLLSITTGLPHPSFPPTLLHYHLLTDAQLDDLAHHYHQRTPSSYSWGYPAPVIGRWWVMDPTPVLEEGEIDEEAETQSKMVEQILGEAWAANEAVGQGLNNEKKGGTKEKRRRFGRFVGMQDCLSPDFVSAEEEAWRLQAEVERWIEGEMRRMEDRDRGREYGRWGKGCL